MIKIITGIFFISPFFLFSQTISGKIENVNGEKILFANIITKDSISATHIKEFALARDGRYSITLKASYSQMVLEVMAIQYQKSVFIIDSFSPAKNYFHDFVLTKDTAARLPGVIVKTKVKSFNINGDTVKYNVSAYRDGSERKIEDVIKKLPGITVNEKTGEIRYNGKPVETVKLDGEDLFSSNYAIGTKNINVDMVDQVQALENYSDNPLLKGVESGDKIALNLTLKKTKTEYSGSMDAGLGFLNPDKTAIDASTVLLGVSQKYKSFATLSYNNVGTNDTPFDYFSYTQSVEQQREANFLAKRYIPDTYFNIDIDPERNNINHSFFGTYNAMFKIGKCISIKTNIFYLHDRINSFQNYTTTNIINGEKFNTSDKYILTKIPQQCRTDFELKYNISTKSLLEFQVKFRNEQIGTAANVLQNDIASYYTDLATHDYFFLQTLTYTQKLGTNKALQLIAKQSIDDAPQQYDFLPPIYDSLNFTSNNQNSKFEKKHLNMLAILSGSAERSKYALTIGTDIENDFYTSTLKGQTGINTILVDGFSNNFYYRKSSAFIASNYKLRVNRWQFMPALSGKYLKQELINHISDKPCQAENYLFEPSFSVSYKVNSYSALLLSSAYKQKPFEEDYFISNPVYVSSRLLKLNEVNLNLQKSKVIGFYYTINNLYRQFRMNLGGNYFENKGNYFSNLTVEQNNTRTVYFFLPQGSKQFAANFLIEKYIAFLQGTFRLTSDYSVLFYKNILNSSILRNNAANMLSSQLFFKTALDGKINFGNTFTHNLLSSKTAASIAFSNQSLNDNFQVIIKHDKRLFFLASADYYLSNTKQPDKSYLFLDASVTFTTKKKIYDLRFSAKNITNNKTFRQIETSDFSTTIFQTNLLPAYFIVNVTRHF